MRFVVVVVLGIAMAALVCAIFIFIDQCFAIQMDSENQSIYFMDSGGKKREIEKMSFIHSFVHWFNYYSCDKQTNKQTKDQCKKK